MHLFCSLWLIYLRLICLQFISFFHFYLSLISHLLSAALTLLSALKVILCLLLLISSVSVKHLQLSATNLWCQKKMNWQNLQFLDWRLLFYCLKSLQWSFSLLLTVIILLSHCLHFLILMHLLFLVWLFLHILLFCCLKSELLFL